MAGSPACLHRTPGSARSNPRSWINPPAKIAHGLGRGCVFQELGNRSAQLAVTHRRDGRSQGTVPEPADDLLVVIVVLPGNEPSDARQQHGNRQSNLLCTARHLAPIAARRFPENRNPASILRRKRGLSCFHLSRGCCTWTTNGGALVSFLRNRLRAALAAGSRRFRLQPLRNLGVDEISLLME